MTEKALSERKKDLVLENRTAALRIARSLLRRWNLFLDLAEVQSLADIALCESVRSFDESRGTKFSTYLYPYIKGVLIAELKSVKRDQLHHSSSLAVGHSHEESNGESESTIYDRVADESASPEHHTYRGELREICNRALESLQPLERETLLGVHVMEHKVAQLARRIGYSRPYLSSIRTRAIEKVQPFFEQLAA